MGVDGVDSWGPQYRFAVDVATLDEHAGCAEVLQRNGVESHVGQAAGRPGVEQRRRLGKVRGDERGLRNQVTHGLDGIVVEQPVTARGDHDGVKHDMLMRVSAKEVPDDTDDARVGKHSDLDRVETHNDNKGLKLLGEKFRWYDLH